MLGKDRFQFESPNAIDAGEAPPSAPGRSRGRRSGGGSGTSGTRGPKRVPAQENVANGERLFRGTKIQISDHDEENPRRCSISTTGSFEGSISEFYEGDENSESTKHDQLPHPDEAQMARQYAAAVLTESFRRFDSDSDDGSAADLAYEEAKPLSSSAISGWRRPSRRKSHLAQNNAIQEREEKRRSFLFLSTNVFCSVLLVVTAIAFFVVVTMVSVRGGQDADADAASSAATGNDGAAAAPVDVNTEMVNSPRFLKTIDWLSKHEVSDMKLLTTETSYQYAAARWIADTDQMREEIPAQVDIDGTFLQFNGTAAEQHEAHQRHVAYNRFLQRYVLAVLFFALGGPGWHKDLSFLSENHECAWFEAEVANDGHEYGVGVTCNQKLLVQDLFLPGNNMEGSIPSEIQYLKELELLSIRHNGVYGAIPTQLARLSSLQYFDVSKNLISGPIPGGIFGRLQSLKALGLAGNALSGKVPTELASLTKLLTLDLGHNELIGHVKTTLGQLTNLRFLYLESNQFEDRIDDSFLINLRHLEELTLNDNKLTSIQELPFHLISHHNLTLLDLSSNSLVGSLPSTFLSTSVKDSQLRVLNLQGNQLTGTIPIALQMLAKLEYLDMSDNDLDGPVPVSLGNMKALKEVYLGENSFDAAIIPPVFFTDLNLRVLSLPNAQLTGQIPPWFAMLTRLEHLDLSGNKLTGSIPSEVWGMPSLTTLLLKSNMLESALPVSFPESQLEIVALDDNENIKGNASDICASNKELLTFAYDCDKVTCTGPCCHSECCTASANSEECFSVLVSSSLQAQDEEYSRGYQANRTIFSFSPGIIRQNLHERE